MLGFDADMQKYGGCLHQNVYSHKLLSLAKLCKLDMNITNVRNVEWRGPSVVDAWIAQAQLMTGTLSKEPQWKKFSILE
jgi:hypothetical protein